MPAGSDASVRAPTWLKRAGAASLALLPEEQAGPFYLDFLSLCRRNWRILGAAFCLGSLTGLLVLLPAATLYQARGTVEVQGISDNLLHAQDGNPNAGLDPELTDIQTQIRIMQSASLLQRVAHKLAQHGFPQQNLLLAAAGSVQVRTAGPTRIIEIGVDSRDPRLAAAFVNTLADEYMQQHVDSRWQGTQLTAEKLTRALQELRIRLEASENALQAYARQTGLLFTADRTSVEEEKLRQVQAALGTAQTERVGRQSRFEAVQSHFAGDVAAVLVDPGITTAQEKITDLRRQMAELTTTYTPDYPKVKRLQAQIEPLENWVRKQITSASEKIHSDFEEASKREAMLGTAYRAQAGLVSDQAQKQIHYDTLRREVESTRQLYDTMLNRVKEAGIASTMRTSNVRVLDPALVPEHPYKPQRLQMALFGGVAGLVLGGLFVVGRDHADRTIQVPGDLGLFLNIPEFGAVPTAFAGSAGLQPPMELIALERRPSLLADSFRSVLASLLLSGDEDRPRAIALTSANASEGKTTVATNLALALSEVGKRVLLIDADLRRPRLHEVFRLPEGAGLVDVLAGKRLADAIRTTPFNNLSIITSGAVQPGSPNLLYGPRLRDVVGYCKENFDIVLLDTPPMLQIPDARVIGRAAGSVMVIVRAGKTSREAALLVCQRLADDGTVVTGTILNDWNPRRSPGGYYGQNGALKAAAKYAGISVG